MYLARGVVDDFCVGNYTMKVPPLLPGTSNLLLYDSTVNRLNQPAMHVIYHDTQAYAEYLITICCRWYETSRREWNLLLFNAELEHFIKF